jgi:2-dehydro-3-deoxygluconokinase
MPDLLCLGEPLIEYNQQQDGRFLRGFGGDVANAAVAAARQGASVGLVSAVGADGHGALLRGLWAEEGVDASAVAEDPERPTGVYFVSHGAEGHRFDYLRRGSAASALGPKALPEAAVRGCRILHLSAITLAISPESCDAAFRAMRIAKEAGARVSFDANLRARLWGPDRARALIDAALALADIALPSLDDIADAAGTREPEAVLAHVRARGPSVVALKLGAEGALLAAPEGRARIAPRPARAVDATGAGDCFDGAFLARLLAGDAAAEAARYAACAASLSTEGYGAVAPIPRAEAVRRALAG